METKFHTSAISLHPSIKNTQLGSMKTSKILKTVLSRLEKETNQALSTGINSLDQVIEGWEEGVIIVSARPKMGKTMLCLNFVHHLIHTINTNEAIVYVTDTVSKEVLIQRLLAIGTQLPLKQIQTGNLSSTELQQLNDHAFLAKLAQDNLVILEHNIPSMFDIRTTLLNVRQAGKKPKIIFIDATPSAGSERGNDKNDPLIMLIQELELLSKELQIPIICTMPLGRSVEHRESHYPLLSDLNPRLVLHASKVLFLIRPEYYEVLTVEHSDIEEAHLIVAKNNGHLDSIKLKLNMYTQKILEDKLMYSLIE